MNDKVNKILQYILYGFLAVSTVLFVIFYIKGESMTTGEEGSMIDTVAYWAYILIGIAVLLIIIFPIMNFIKHPKTALVFLGVVLVFAILYGISYIFASGSIEGNIYEKLDITEGISRFIGTCMITTYVIGTLAILSIIVFGIINAFK
jgi:hypothetical protein